MTYLLETGCKSCGRLQAGTYRISRLLNTGAKTHYDVLGVSRNASQEQIKQAYKQLCKKYHPDANPGNPSNHDKIVIINNAYEVLKKESSRREYDSQIGLSHRLHDHHAHSHTYHVYRHRPPHSDGPRHTHRRTSGPRNIKWKNPYENDETIHQKYRESMERDEAWHREQASRRDEAWRRQQEEIRRETDELQRRVKEQDLATSKRSHEKLRRLKELAVVTLGIAAIVFILSQIVSKAQEVSHNAMYDRQVERVEQQRRLQKEQKERGKNKQKNRPADPSVQSEL